MDITNNDMVKEICERLDLMLSFAEKAGVSMEGLPNYCLTNDVLSYVQDACSVKEENDELREQVSITLDEIVDRVRVKKTTRYSHDFQFCENNPECQNYCTVCHQVITEFLVRNGKLEVTTAAVTQTIDENTFFAGTETIIDFDSIADFKKTSKLDALPQNHSLKIEIKTYSIPEDYHITDGVGPIDNNPKVMEKTTQS